MHTEAAGWLPARVSDFEPFSGVGKHRHCLACLCVKPVRMPHADAGPERLALTASARLLVAVVHRFFRLLVRLRLLHLAPAFFDLDLVSGVDLRFL